MFEAAVGGGIPIMSAIKENLAANDFQSVFGISTAPATTS